MPGAAHILQRSFRVIAVAGLLSAHAAGAFAATCASGAGTLNWGTAATWSCGHVPLAADDVVVATSTTTLNVNVPASCLSLSFTAGAGATTVAINGTNSLSVGGSVTVNASTTNNVKSLNVGAGTLTVNGTLTLTGGTGTRTADLLIGTGTASVAGNLAVNGGNSRVTFSDAGTLNVGGNFGNGAAFTRSTGTVAYNGSGAQSVGVYNYYNLTVNKSAGTATLTGSIAPGNNLTVSAGTLDLSMSTANRSSAGGALTVANGATLKIGGGNTFPANYTTHSLGATSTVDYSGTGQAVTNEAYGHLNLSGSGTKSLPSTAMTVAGNLTLAGTSTATAGAAVTVNGDLIAGAGTTFNAGTFTHNLKGNLSNSGTLTPGTSTFNFNGTAAQSITGASTFNHLTLANPAGVTANSAVTVNGNFTLNAAAIFNAGSSGHALKGNFVNNGTFNAGTGTLTFNGTAAQTLTGATVFNGLTMNNAAGLTINNDVSVSGVLTFTGGNIATGANAVVVTPAGSVTRTSGHVVGNLRKNFATAANVSQTFEIGTGANYTPVAVTFAAVSVAGNLTASTTTPDHPQLASSGIDGTRSVNRYWTLTKDGTLAFTTFGATFNFVASDVDAGANTANFIVQRYVAPDWFTTSLVAALATSTQVSGVAGVGDFAIGLPRIVGFLREKEFVFSRELY